MKNFLKIFTIISCMSLQMFAQTPTQHIRLNQLGFLPFAQKYAAIVNTEASIFNILDVNNSNAVVFSTELEKAAIWAASGESVKIADFSIFAKPGNYILEIPGYGQSYPFSIGDSVFLNVSNAIVKAFYFNRASTALLPEHAGIYARPAGHPDTIVIVLPSAAGPTRIAGDTIKAAKGWYDAGDYNKYIVNSGITTGTLLHAYEMYSSHYDTITWNIPESSNNIPDLLDEIKWNLDWMLTMQDPADGGVYNKTTEASFSASKMPHEVTSKRYVVAKGTAAALDFAAVMAIAARVYKPFYPSFADSCLTAAQYAWQWALQNPSLAFRNPSAEDGYPAVSTGGYGDTNFSDERIWAATELYITTLDESYISHINLNYNYDIPSWPNVAMLSQYALYIHKNTVGETIDTAKVKTNITSRAFQLKSALQTNPYRTSISTFNWGSNGGIANHGVNFLFAFEITGELEYFNAALSAYDYILGRNATEFSFVTGYGGKASQNVHHRPSEADGIPGSIPGFLAGGPNGGNKTDCGGVYPTQPAKAYRDAICSYTTNEIAINWQAPLSFLSHAITIEYKKWVAELPDTFAIPSTHNIRFSQNQEKGHFSVFSNVEYSIETEDTWYNITPKSYDGSAVFDIEILEFNNGDSIRNGSFRIMIDTILLHTIDVEQFGKMKNFRVEAEDYYFGFGVQTEATLDEGGGMNVGWIDNNDYAMYTIPIFYTGSYRVDYRISGLSATGELVMIHQDSAYSLIFPSPSGGWQTWKTMSDTAYFTEGVYDIKLLFYKGGYNLNYIDFTFLTEDNIAPMHYPTSFVEIRKKELCIQNPVKHSLLKIFGTQHDTQYTISIATMNGVEIYTTKIQGSESSVYLPIPAGTYICNIISDSNQANSFVLIKI